MASMANIPTHEQKIQDEMKRIMLEQEKPYETTRNWFVPTILTNPMILRNPEMAKTYFELRDYDANKRLKMLEKKQVPKDVGKHILSFVGEDIGIPEKARESLKKLGY